MAGWRQRPATRTPPLAKLLPQVPELAEGFADHLQVCAGGSSGGARIVPHGNFANAMSRCSGTQQDFGGDERTVGAHRHRLQNLAAEEFEAAVDVAQFEAEEHPLQATPRPRVHPANEMVLTIHPVADHHRASVDLFEQPADLLEIELQV